ncbi:MAG: hypothetical protein A3E40_03225, partial [Candidatus Levybacteria bacterium RIFCSPHIGHO2_12_FULL_37_9]
MNRKIKVLVLTSSFPRNNLDWWARFILNIYRFLSKSTFGITVLAPHSPKAKFKETIDSILVLRFPYFLPFSLEKLTTGSGILHSSKTNMLAFFQVPILVGCEVIFTFYQLLIRRYDVIHAHWIIPQGLIALIGKFFFGKKVIVTVHGTDVYGLKSLRILKRIVFMFCDVCTVNSRATMKSVLDIYDKTNVKIIPMGVDLAVFSPLKKSKAWRKTFGQQNFILLAVGRLIECKGFEYLIKSIARLYKKYPIKLVIVGSGSLESKLRQISEDLSVVENVIFLGNLRHESLAHAYASSDLFIAPSITDPHTGETEGQNVAVLEALASGLPVVASDSGGIPDAIKDLETGLLVNEKDIESLSKAIERMLSDKS